MGLGMILNEASEKEMKYPHSRVSMCVVVCVCVCVSVFLCVFLCEYCYEYRSSSHKN